MTEHMPMLLLPMSAVVSASALSSVTHFPSVCHKFMVIVLVGFFFSFLQKDDPGNWQWGGAMDFIDNFLETSFKNTALKQLIKAASLIIFLPVFTSRTVLFAYFLIIGKINLRVRLAKSSVIMRRKVELLYICSSTMLWNYPFPRNVHSATG